MAAGSHRRLDGAVRRLESMTTELWVIAIVFFGIGDVGTTMLGLSAGHLVEVGPLAAPIIKRHGIIALVGLKLVAFAVCTALWYRSSSPSAVGVPLGLATLGVLVTGWNTALIIMFP